MSLLLDELVRVHRLQLEVRLKRLLLLEVLEARLLNVRLRGLLYLIKQRYLVAQTDIFDGQLERVVRSLGAVRRVHESKLSPALAELCLFLEVVKVLLLNLAKHLGIVFQLGLQAVVKMQTELLFLRGTRNCRYTKRAQYLLLTIKVVIWILSHQHDITSELLRFQFFAFRRLNRSDYRSICQG